MSSTLPLSLAFLMEDKKKIYIYKCIDCAKCDSELGLQEEFI